MVSFLPECFKSATHEDDDVLIELEGDLGCSTKIANLFKDIFCSRSQNPLSDAPSNTSSQCGICFSATAITGGIIAIVLGAVAFGALTTGLGIGLISGGSALVALALAIALFVCCTYDSGESDTYQKPIERSIPVGTRKKEKEFQEQTQAVQQTQDLLQTLEG